jgi:hypothetical protein
MIRCPHCSAELDPAVLVTPALVERVARRTAEIFSEENPLTKKLSRESTGVSDRPDLPAAGLPQGIPARTERRKYRCTPRGTGQVADSRHAEEIPDR